MFNYFIKKIERNHKGKNDFKKSITWRMRWLNKNVDYIVTLNATFHKT